MKPRPDLLDKKSPSGVEVFQLTEDPDAPSSHIYMEAQIFTPDSRRLVLWSSAAARPGAVRPSGDRLVLCDLEDHGRLTALTDEPRVRGPAISPDGLYLYYFVNETALNAGRVILRRVRLDGTDRQTVVVLDHPLPGTRNLLGGLHVLSTISSDGRRIVTAGFLGDGISQEPPFGLIAFDLQKATAELILQGPTWTTPHPQYCRSTDPDASHDLLIQENHGSLTDPTGRKLRNVDSGPGLDIHVVRDDGSNFRNMPWGRDQHEYCQGHQVWRGRSTAAIATVGSPAKGHWSSDPCQWFERIIESTPVPHDGHTGCLAPDARRNDLSRSFSGQPRFFHFATDIQGQRLIIDNAPAPERGCLLFLATLGKPLEDPVRRWTYLLDTQTSFWKNVHPHPFLSPDGSLGFFNSDETGISQAYMISGLDNVGAHR